MQLTLILLLTASFAVTAELQPSPEPYQFVEYPDFLKLMDELAKSPLSGKIFKTYDGFQEFDIKARPLCKQDTGEVCRNPVFEVTSFYKGPEHVASLPVVLLVGGMHGDEVTGSNAFYQLIRIFEKFFGARDEIKELLERVRLIIVPISNPSGFATNNREEQTAFDGSQDPNRDFPYDADGCFQTATARLLDAIFMNNLVVGCLTFHGGDNSITYPWGNYPHESKQASEDNTAFVAIAQMLQKAAGSNPKLGIEEFSTNTMSAGVYSVKGGFEDYAYGAGFDFANINKKCKYSVEKGKEVEVTPNYKEFGPRAFIYLVEASNSKRPHLESLGNEAALLNRDFAGETWGHLDRSMNLALRYSQMMHGYVKVSQVSYSEGAYLLAADVYGCISLDGVTSPNGEIEILTQDYNNRSNQWTLKLKHVSDAESLSELKLSVACDSSFAQDAKAQSHFVRLRTGQVSEAKGHGSFVKSFPKFEVSVLGIRRALLDTALIKWNPGNVHSMAYDVVLTASSDLGFKWADGKVAVHMAPSAEKVEIFDFDANEIGKRPPAPPSLIIKQGDDIPMSLQTFLELPGKVALLYNNKEDPNAVVATTIKLSSSTKGGLIVPENGLVARIATPSPQMVVMARLVEPLTLVVKFVSPYRAIQNFGVVDQTNDWKFTEDVQALAFGLYLVQRTYKLTSQAQALINGQLFEVVNAAGASFRFVFGHRDRWEREANIIQAFFSRHNGVNSVLLPIIIFATLFILLGSALMFMSRSKNVLREPLDVQMADVQIGN